MITNALKTALKYIWNVLLIGLITLAALSIIPRAFPEMIEPAKNHAHAVSLPLITRLQGLGLLLGITACLSSLMSFCWRSISRPARFMYAAIFSTLLIGTIATMAVDISNRGHISYHDYLTFLIVVSLFLAPLIVYGKGYPQSLLDLASNKNKGKR